jgi:CheY-like chemotaxis protein
MKRILFIDDDVLALQLMSKVTHLLGFQAILTTSPRSALEMVVDEKPQLVMVDMLMDEMDGAEFVSMLRQLPATANLPVLIYSAGAGWTDEELARKAGANGYLRKPVGLQELSKAIQAYMPA